MGTWGAGLYQDDTACDIRDEYRSYIARGIDEPEATTRIFRKYGYAFPASSPIKDHAEVVIWLVLADTQYRIGRRNETVKQTALHLIDSGHAIECLLPLLDSYEESGALNKKDKQFVDRRKKALARLQEKLLASPPSPKILTRRRYAMDPGYQWNLGKVYAYRNNTLSPILLLPVAWQTLPEFYDGDEIVKTPLFYLLEWDRERMPTASEIPQLSLRMFPDEHFLPFYQPVALSLYCVKAITFPLKHLTALNVEYDGRPQPVMKKVKSDGSGIEYVQNGKVIRDLDWGKRETHPQDVIKALEGMVEPSYYHLEWKHFDAWLSGDFHRVVLHRHN
jgi:hypothetical protein